MLSKKFKKDLKTGDFVLPGAGVFFAKQKEQYPNMSDLYKSQMEEFLKTASPKIRYSFPSLCPR